MRVKTPNRCGRWRPRLPGLGTRDDRGRGRSGRGRIRRRGELSGKLLLAHLAGRSRPEGSSPSTFRNLRKGREVLRRPPGLDMLIRTYRSACAKTSMLDRLPSDTGELVLDLIQLTALRHALAGDFYGLQLIESFARRGHRLSAGTVYPMLHGLERRGLVTSFQRRGDVRRLYRTTARGRRALERSSLQFREVLVDGTDAGPVPTNTTQR